MTSFPPKRRSTRIVLLGFGAINRRVAELLKSRNSSARVVGIIVKHPQLLPSDLIGEVATICSPEDLLALQPDTILEAATREAVQKWGQVALRAARRLVVSSTSAFADDQVLESFREVAKQFGSQLVLSPGALGGMDALSAAARLGMREVCHRIVKSPQSWGSPLGETTASPTHKSLIILFRGSAREAAKRYPLNANVAVVSSLSGIGLDATQVELVSDPLTANNRHEIRATGDFGSLTVTLENRPLQANPKSSELAALALVRLVENEVSDLAI